MHGNPDIAEIGKPYQIDSTKARAMAALRWHPVDENPSTIQTIDPKLNRIAPDYRPRQLKRVMNHIESIHEQLEQTVDPKGVLALTAALDKLYTNARILRGESLPPVLKAPSQSKRSQSSMPVPE